MEVKHILIPWMLIFFVNLVNLGECKFSSETILRLLSDTKAELARSFFKRELLKKESPTTVNITHTTIDELLVNNSGQNTRMFRSSDESFFYNGSDVLQLHKSQSPDTRYSLSTVDDVRLGEGAVFFKNAEWKNKMFLVICYGRGYCEVRMSTVNNVNLRTKIDTGVLPLDVHFFNTEEDLFLIVVKDPVTVYKWTGTYFNEDYHLDTTGAQSVAAFQDSGKSIVVVAQNLGKNKVYSKVYIRKNDKIELLQLLPTTQALRVLHFNLTHGNDILHFVFVLNNIESSSIFWWTGKEFVLWKSMKNLNGQRIVYVGRIGSEVFFFISHGSKVLIYHPTVISFDLMQIITLDQEVVGVDLRLESDHSPLLVLLSGSPLDPYFKVNLILLRLNYMPTIEEEKSSDGILRCLTNLKEKLEERENKVMEILEKMENRPPVVFAQDLKLISLEDSISEFSQKMKIIQEKLNSVHNRTEGSKTVRYHVYGDVNVNVMDAHAVDVEVLNGKNINFGNILSINKEQNINGSINLKTIFVDNLIAPSINGIATKDMLLRNKKEQKIKGEYTLSSLTAEDIEFVSDGKFNAIPFSEIVTHNSKTPIKGTKIFPKLKTKQLQVEKINNMPADEWVYKILPKVESAREEEPLNFTRVSIERLLVSNLNGIAWDDFMNSVYLPLNNETIKGNLRVEGSTEVYNLSTKKINGVPVLNLTERSEGSITSCKYKIPEKQYKEEKSLPINISPVWDDSFLKDLLNDPNSPLEGDVKYFTGTENIQGDLRVSYLYFKNPAEISGTQVENIENLKEEFWMKSEDQIISVPVEFQEVSINSSLKTEKINDKNLNSFIWTDSSNSIFTKLVFENIEVLGDVDLDKSVVQNIDIRNLYTSAVKSTGENVVSGYKQFLGNLTVKNLYVDILNGMDVSDFRSLMNNRLVNSDKIVVSELIIHGDINARKGVEVKVINDIDFNDTITKALTWDDPHVLEKAQFRSLKVENINADTINGINVEDKLPKLSKAQEKDVYVVVEGNLEVGDLNATKVNGINFDKYINQVFQINSTQTIRGEKIFKRMVTVTGNLNGTLNDYNITELEKRALSKSKAQTITGVYTAEEFKGNDVEAEVVDGVPTDQLLYQDNDSLQIIQSDIIFNNIAVAGDITAPHLMNDCDLLQVSEKKVENLETFETLEVKGDLNWNISLEDVKGLSYFLTNAVTVNGNHNITGPVTFESNVSFEDVSGKGQFNDINLDFIAADAVLKSVPEQEITVPVTFKGSVKANSIDIENNVIVDSVNGVDIMDFEDRLVRKSTDVIVRGKKIFKSGFSANHFDVETINSAPVNKIVFYDDLQEIHLPPTTFKKLNIFNDLRLKNINGYIFDDIFQNILSKNKDQTVEGDVTIEGNVYVDGDGNIERMNDVNIEETILTDEEVSAKVITGDIEFRDVISIADNLQVDYINGHNITSLFEKALMVYDNLTIHANIEFTTDITVNKNIEVNNTVNSCDLHKITKMDFTDGSDETNEEIRATLNKEINELANLTEIMNKPVIFMYLDEVAKLNLQLPNIHGGEINIYNNTVEFNVYGMNYNECGLPRDCYCPTQTNVIINSMEPFNTEIEANSTRFFKYHDEELEVELKVATNTVSYSSRCKKPDEEVLNESTSVSWRKYEKGHSEILTHKIFKGFLSDVKFFKLGDSIYVIMAFYFHPSKNQTNNLHTIVYELKVHAGKIHKVDEIPSNGAQVLEVFWTTRGVILVIGNSFDSDKFTDSVNSAIYRFNEYENKFELLRFVKTHGVLSIKSMRFKKTSFIFFVQKQTWPLLILKYNTEYDNYYFSQKLDTAQSLVRSNFLSITVINTSTPGYSGDLFVGIVLSDDSFRLFKYKHIEGFVEESYQEQNNVRILQSFWMGPYQYLLAGSASDVSKIYKFVEQGR